MANSDRRSRKCSRKLHENACIGAFCSYNTAPREQDCGGSDVGRMDTRRGISESPMHRCASTRILDYRFTRRVRRNTVCNVSSFSQPPPTAINERRAQRLTTDLLRPAQKCAGCQRMEDILAQ